ncbi:MAG: DUF5522 domain-containing protein [Pyrinomonadaceae bacterium]
MNDRILKHKDNVEQSQTFVEGLDFYFENGLMVLTRVYLLKRGYCCKSGCRHCPYGFTPQTKSE